MCLHLTHPPAVQYPGTRYRSSVLLVKSSEWISLVHVLMVMGETGALRGNGHGENMLTPHRKAYPGPCNCQATALSTMPQVTTVIQKHQSNTATLTLLQQPQQLQSWLAPYRWQRQRTRNFWEVRWITCWLSQHLLNKAVSISRDEHRLFIEPSKTISSE